MSNPLFFNYHEFSVHEYQLLDSPLVSSHETPLIITHFPNIYHPLNSIHSTRIVRIPRTFSKQYPQFSNILPGNETGAISDSNLEFLPIGMFNKELFGTSSISPLSNYLSEEEFTTLMDTINSFLFESFEFNWWNLFDYLIDLLTFWFLFDIIKSRDKKVSIFNLINTLNTNRYKCLDKLESFIQDQNDTLKNRSIRIISPRRSGYLSLDIEIPRPTINTALDSLSENNKE